MLKFSFLTSEKMIGVFCRTIIMPKLNGNRRNMDKRLDQVIEKMNTESDKIASDTIEMIDAELGRLENTKQIESRVKLDVRSFQLLCCLLIAYSWSFNGDYKNNQREEECKEQKIVLRQFFVLVLFNFVFVLSFPLDSH